MDELASLFKKLSQAQLDTANNLLSEALSSHMSRLLI
jgi:hypothetical protein